MIPRIYLEVRWKASEKLWAIKRRDISGGVVAYEPNKELAERRGGREAGALHRTTGALVELVIYNQNGQIGKGSRGRRTYGHDPRRRKG